MATLSWWKSSRRGTWSTPLAGTLVFARCASIYRQLVRYPQAAPPQVRIDPATPVLDLARGDRLGLTFEGGKLGDGDLDDLSPLQAITGRLDG